MADLHLRGGRYEDDRTPVPDLVLHRASGYHHTLNGQILARFCTPRAVADAIAATGWGQGDNRRTLVGEVLHPNRWTTEHVITEAATGRRIIYTRVSMELPKHWRVQAAQAVERASLEKRGG